MPEDPLFLDASGGAPAYTGRELRRGMAILLTQGVSDRFGARSGISPAGNQALTVSGMTVTVNDLKAVVYQSGTSLRGPYLVQIPTKTHPVPTADPTNPRKDIVQLRVWDDPEDSSGLRKADTEYKSGTAAPSPSEPAVDSGAFRLATIDIPAGSSTPTLTFNAPFTVAHGGVLPTRNTGELPTVGRYEGMYADKADTNELMRFDGSAWTAYGSQYRPIVSNQSSSPPFDVTATWTAFTGSAWAATNFTVPPSGQVRIYLSATLGNDNSTASTARLTFQLSGGHTLSAAFARALTGAGAKDYHMTLRVPVTGMTPGASVTLTPYWYISSGSAASCKLTDGVIEIDPTP